MSQNAYAEMDPRAAFDLLDHFRILDVREDHEYHGPLGHIERAESLPLSQVAERLDELDGDAPLLFVCRSGKRSGMACEQVVQRGRPGVTNLTGGMIGWHRAGLPAVRSEPATLAALVEQIVAWFGMVGPHAREALDDDVRERFARQAVTPDSPSHRAVEELIEHVGESLAAADPPDLELCLAAFRRSLAVL